MCYKMKTESLLPIVDFCVLYKVRLLRCENEDVFTLLSLIERFIENCIIFIVT